MKRLACLFLALPSVPALLPLLALVALAGCSNTASRPDGGGGNAGVDLSIAFPGCDDGVKNADEADVDCGGVCATKCTSGLACKKKEDCESGLCVLSMCAPPNQCTNGVKDGVESYGRVVDLMVAERRQAP